jgi:methionyl-tRNA formyltransferase
MRAIIVGAVDSTRMALRRLAAAVDWDVCALVTLPPELAARHSDYVDLAPDARAIGASVIHAADSNAPDVIAAVAALVPDMVFVIGWSQICRPAFRAAAGGNVIGYHPAPLPRLRGRGVLPWTILLGEPITAGTLFWIDDGVDTGDILAQQFFHVGDDESVTSLYARHLDVLGAMLDEALPRLARPDPPRRQQDEAFASWAARRVPADGAIDWQRPAAEIARLVRAVSRPYPGAFSAVRGETLTMWCATAEPGARHQAAVVGQVVERTEASFAVRCGCGGLLRVTEWHSPSGAMPPLHARLEPGR